MANESEVTGVRVRGLTADDLPSAHGLSRNVQWPHRLADWQFALALGTGYAAELDGELVGTAMCWRFGRDQATLGMVIVKSKFRGRGIGQLLVATALEQLGDRSVQLHATPEGQGLYERLGFVAFGETSQHQGAAFAAPLVALAKGERLRPVGRRDGPKLAALDGQAAGMPRRAALDTLLTISDGVVLDKDGEPAGFALLRRSGRGYVIGPVIAPDPERAKALIGYWIGRHAGHFLRIDVPVASGLPDWLDGLGLPGVGTVTEMVRGPAPRRTATMRRFALVNQALG